LSTTGSVPQFGSAAVGASVAGAAVAGAAVAGAAVAGAAVAGAAVAGAAVVAGVPQAESSMDTSISTLINGYSTDFLFISLSPFYHELRI
jgi:hypothetical protein